MTTTPSCPSLRRRLSGRWRRSTEILGMGNGTDDYRNEETRHLQEIGTLASRKMDERRLRRVEKRCVERLMKDGNSRINKYLPGSETKEKKIGSDNAGMENRAKYFPSVLFFTDQQGELYIKKKIDGKGVRELLEGEKKRMKVVFHFCSKGGACVLCRPLQCCYITTETLQSVLRTAARRLCSSSPGDRWGRGQKQKI